jgi:hypothetical protein
MPFNRRGILAGLLGTPLGITALKAMPLPAETQKAIAFTPEVQKAVENIPPLPTPKRNLHPLFGFQTIDAELGFAYTLRSRYSDAVTLANPEPRISIQINKVVAGGTYYPTMDAAEDAIFSKFAITHREVRSPDNPEHTKFHLVRAANRIAQTTRRGMGNVILVHRDDLHLLDTPWVANVIPERIGRWSNVGFTHNRVSQVWVTDRRVPAIPHGNALVGYRGSELDAPAVLTYHPGFGYSYAMNEKPETYMHVVGLTVKARAPHTDEAIWAEEKRGAVRPVRAA